MAERGVPEVVSQCDRLGEVFIEVQRSGYSSGYLRDLKRVRKTGHVVIAQRRVKDLSLVFETSKGLAVSDPVPIPLEFGP